MGLFGRSKENNTDRKERKELKGQIDKVMKGYDDGEMDGATFLQSMMDLTTSHQKRKKK